MDYTQMSDDDLRAAIAAATQELARRAGSVPAAQPMRVTRSFGSYNARRHGRPWIALVTSWPVGDRPKLTFGGYVGDNYGGDVEIMAHPGDIIRSGQKDNRGNKTDNDWFVVEADGSLTSVDQAEARKIFDNKGGK